MLNKVNKLLIGKDIARTANVTGATAFATVILSTNLKDGEVVVLDKNKVPLTIGATVADSDTIFICQGTSVTYTYNIPYTGTSVTARQVNISDPIQGAKVLGYRGTAYAAKAEQAITHQLTGTPVAATEYIVRIVYKDMPEHPGQFTQTYRHIATATTAGTTTTLATALAAKINAHAGRRVNATTSTDTLILTARENPDCCTALTDIDQFSMVEFDSFVDYVSPTGVLTIFGNTKVKDGTGSSVKCEYGSGNWEQIRDLEKTVLGNRGVMDLVTWPVKAPVQDTTLDGYYDLIIIEHDAEYLSPDNQYRKSAPKKTTIALATASTGINTLGQASNVVAVLNTWMASTPGAFPAISATTIGNLV
jgi:hypothetical protein